MVDLIKIEKSNLPDGCTIKHESDYRSEPVFGLICSDCHNKCYICENKRPSSFNVEHVIPVAHDPSLKFEWSNLLFSCTHCNGVKNKYFVPILNCSRIDPEAHISLRVDPIPKCNVEVQRIGGEGDENSEKEIENTISLLDQIYNGGNTSMRNKECENLREFLVEEVSQFIEKLKDYFSEDSTECKQVRILSEIKKGISRKSAFSAFKRGIIRRNKNLLDIFGEYLD